MKGAYTKYISGLILFGLNGIVSSKILMSSYEIVFFRTLIGSVFLAAVYFLFAWRERHRFAVEMDDSDRCESDLGKADRVDSGVKKNLVNMKKEALFVILSGIGCYLYFSDVSKLPVANNWCSTDTWRCDRDYY